MDALKTMGEKLLPTLKGAVDDVVKAIRDNKEGLEKLGHFIANNVIPIIGWLVKYGIKAAVEAIVGFITVIGHLVDAFQFWRAYTVESIKFVVDAVRNSIGFLVHGADAAFGWIPGLGPKLHKAASDFDKFFAKVDNELDKLAGKKTTIYIDTLVRLPGTKGSLRAYQEGGVVPGTGPQLAVVHGGERVIPAGGAGGSQQPSITIKFAGGTDSAFATAFMKLVRTGQIQIA